MPAENGRQVDDIDHLKALLYFPAFPDDIEPVFADIPGPAFFPGGSGVLARDRRATRTLPRRGAMVLGHNFSNVRYYKERRAVGCEDLRKGTWGSLLRFLDECGIAVEACFFTNALMGLMRAPSNIGSVRGHEDPQFRKRCLVVFQAALQLQQPQLILALGMPSIRFVAEAFGGDLGCWAAVGKQAFRLIDKAPGGPVRHKVALPDGQGTASIVALLHPSNRRRNLKWREFRGEKGGKCEHAMVAEGLRHWRVPPG